MSEIKLSDGRLAAGKFENIFLAEDRDFWDSCPFPYVKERDLVLTLDFGLFKMIRDAGGSAAFLDHIVDRDVAEKYNYAIYKFLAGWFKDEDGKDIFTHKGAAFGNAFRLEIWNDATYYCRMALSLLALRGLKSGRIYAGMGDGATLRLIRELGIEAHHWKLGKAGNKRYYFPVFRWMRERIYPSWASPKKILKAALGLCLDAVNWLGDLSGRNGSGKGYIFTLDYFPTAKIIERLKAEDKLRVVSLDYSWSKGLPRGRRLPIPGLVSYYRKEAAAILKDFGNRKSARMMVEGFDLSGTLYDVFLGKVSRTLPDYMKAIDGIRRFFGDKDLRLMLTFSSIGMVNCLALGYCRENNIPTYLVINGLLGNPYLDEAKDAAWINSYGESIRDNYFKGIPNVVCLGDPRMDGYIGGRREREVNRSCPEIVIGAAGFNNVDLNSYLAYEFDFLNDILAICVKLQKAGRKMNLTVKVRSNGYIGQYEDFIREYYPGLDVKIYDSISMKQLLAQADLYISIYSQTLFEASCLGIPALYYKKDTEYMDAPFDGKSELVTALDPAGLERKMEAFYAGEPIYESFGKKSIMEKYVGPLDGKNLERNMEFIYSLAGI